MFNDVEGKHTIEYTCWQRTLLVCAVMCIRLLSSVDLYVHQGWKVLFSIREAFQINGKYLETDQQMITAWAHEFVPTRTNVWNCRCDVSSKLSAPELNKKTESAHVWPLFPTLMCNKRAARLEESEIVKNAHVNFEYCY
jgi:hypothetical protein